MRRIVVWLTTTSWEACVDAVAGAATQNTEVVLLHVVAAELSSALLSAATGLPEALKDRAELNGRRPVATTTAAAELIDAAERRLGRRAGADLRFGQCEPEVLDACDGADLLIFGRDGDQSELGPDSLTSCARFILDHAPCAVLLIWPSGVPADD
jgi:nucleotide-binding universal stress UspA family protein